MDMTMTVDEFNYVLETLYKARTELMRLHNDLKDCRNELCLKCGAYKERHLGACDWCRWKERGNG